MKTVKNMYCLIFKYFFMKITEVKIDYKEPTFPGGLEVREMQEILMRMDWLNAEQITAETSRCNNRCNGNDTEVSVPVLKTRTIKRG